MYFNKLSTIERVYNIGLEHDSIEYLFNYINKFILESESDLIKLYDLKILNKLSVSQIMSSRVVTVNENDSVDFLNSVIRKHKHLGYPVVDSDKELVGIVTFNDLEKKSVLGKTKIKDIMTKSKDLVTIRCDESALAAQKLMIRSKVGRLIVLDEENNILGIISKTDILKTNEIYSKKNTKIKDCKHITNLYFYDTDITKLERLKDSIIILMSARGYIISEKEDYVEVKSRDWDAFAKLVKNNNGELSHISIDTKLLDIMSIKVIKEMMKTIEKEKFEEIVITDHVTMVNEKSAIQRVITDFALFEDSKRTFGTITVRVDL
ncbi:CBS domain-containing protein [Methanococcus voltae]|uniref:CBS domain-containing protein n=1 Tax=Methanococcus voltae TaxID=2188 RepID=UPI001AE5AA5D|nr:CBS domain-containing protein [Methanococcus voltae]MBP2143719.1 CBS domain-containing protein [Methanococcus voltae]